MNAMDRTIDRPLVTLVVFIVCLAPSTRPHASAEEAPKATAKRAEIVEVKGAYVKFTLSDGQSAQKGQRARLYRDDAPIAGDAVVTAVTPQYAVAKVAGAQPQIGDRLEITAKAAGPEDALDSAVGSLVDVVLRSGRELNAARLLGVERDEPSGELRLLRLALAERNREMALGAPAIAKIAREGKLLYESSQDVTNATATSQDPVRPASKQQRLTRAERLAKQQEAQKQKAEEEKQAWLARLRERHIRPWPELTEEEHTRALEEYKKFVESDVMPVHKNLQKVETNNFVVYTSIPLEQSAFFIQRLDALHDMMCKMYNMPTSTRVFKGKAIVLAFLTFEEFSAFENRFMANPVRPGTYGLCHHNSEGRVLVACYRGNNPADFAGMLVHETSHGFIARYKTPVRMPSWVNEGMAEWIAEQLVSASKAVKRKEMSAFKRMQQTRTVGPNLFTMESNIDFNQYGIASSLTTFLIKTNPKAYVTFIELLKEGVEQEEALKQSYGVSSPQLIASYGQAIGIPDLRP